MEYFQAEEIQSSGLAPKIGNFLMDLSQSYNLAFVENPENLDSNSIGVIQFSDALTDRLIDTASIAVNAIRNNNPNVIINSEAARIKKNCIPIFRFISFLVYKNKERYATGSNNLAITDGEEYFNISEMEDSNIEEVLNDIDQ